MEHSRPNQKKRIIEYITDFGSITQFEAQERLGVQRLPSRITELKKDGYIFTYKWETVKNRYGEKCRVKRYSIEGKR